MSPRLGLKIDADTLRGTRDGVLPLLRLLRKRGIRASFFFSVGPDNMGRHLWRLLKPAFLAKMLKSGAPGLYGWEILLRGTLWPGPLIGPRCREVIRAAAADGHEIGLHAWDHHAWQKHALSAGSAFVQQELQRGHEALAGILGGNVACSAAPGWRADTGIIRHKEAFGFRYNSDCRGRSIFLPSDDRWQATQPQIPTTLPTFDELVGRQGITPDNYNRHLVSLLQPGELNVLTLHAEVEGLRYHDLFAEFLELIRPAGWTSGPLGDLLPHQAPPTAKIGLGEVPGREGRLAVQSS